jgi:hypothetical protein
MNRLLAKIPALLLTLIVGLIASSSAFATATIVIVNNDAAGVGFNDPTAAAPVGGNTGTTVGQQRLIAFQAAANIWGATLTSGPTIVISARWLPLTCSASSGALGSAGNTGSVWRNFTGSVPGFWYGNALANALTNTDLGGAGAEISAQFNVNLGTPGCLSTQHWYYGLDNNHGATGVDLVTVVVHELGHGLGFQTFTSSTSGAQLGGFPTIYDRFLFDKTQGKTWADPTMTDALRQASAINTGNLVWNGPQVTGDAPGVLSGNPRLRVNSPPGIAGNYVVGTASFGPALSSPGVTGSLVQALDPADGAGGLTTDGCSALTNPGAVNGNIALIDRGTCTFVTKVTNAQNAGAVGVVIANNAAGVITMSGGPDPTIVIPSVMISQADGATIKAQLGGGVNVTLSTDTSSLAGADSLARPLMFAPNPVAAGSSVSHWDTSALPNQLMEPNINDDLTHSVTTPQDLTFSLLRDIGWCAGCPQPPPPSPTPTPSPPPNDNFANAQSIGGCSGNTTGTNVAATKEAGEPNHPDSPTSRKSVWYQWQSPTTASVTIDTLGSNFDTVLAVYTGTTVSGLTLVASNDDIGSGNTASRVTFAATQGTVYRIAVDGFDNNADGGDTGNITLNWTESNCTFKSKKTGVFRPSTGELFLKNANSSGFADTLIVFGNPGDYPLAGDWNGDGIDSVGIYRNGIFYLRNTNTTGFADIVVPFGNAGDQPVVGDWNGDGIDTIGVYRNGTFLLRNSNTAGPPDLVFTLGNPGDIGIAGDWNGDGITTCGVFRPSNGVVFLKNSNTTGFADLSFVYGIAGDQPVAGDWNGDGIDTVGIYRNGQFFLTNSNTTGFADTVFALGNNGDFPIAGNWNGSP